MHLLVILLAGAAVLGLLLVVSLAIAGVAASTVDDDLSEREARRRAACTSAWDGVERRDGTDRRLRAQSEIGAAVGPRGGERRIGGRRLHDGAAPGRRAA